MIKVSDFLFDDIYLNFIPSKKKVFLESYKDRKVEFQQKRKLKFYFVYLLMILQAANYIAFNLEDGSLKFNLLRILNYVGLILVVGF